MQEFFVFFSKSPDLHQIHCCRRVFPFFHFAFPLFWLLRSINALKKITTIIAVFSVSLIILIKCQQKFTIFQKLPKSSIHSRYSKGSSLNFVNFEKNRIPTPKNRLPNPKFRCQPTSPPIDHKYCSAHIMPYRAAHKHTSTSAWNGKMEHKASVFWASLLQSTFAEQLEYTGRLAAVQTREGAEGEKGETTNAYWFTRCRKLRSSLISGMIFFPSVAYFLICSSAYWWNSRVSASRADWAETATVDSRRFSSSSRRLRTSARFFLRAGGRPALRRVVRRSLRMPDVARSLQNNLLEVILIEINPFSAVSTPVLWVSFYFAACSSIYKALLPNFQNVATN